MTIRREMAIFLRSWVFMCRNEGESSLEPSFKTFSLMYLEGLDLGASTLRLLEENWTIFMVFG